MNKPFRLAVASKEGLAITEHFGHAKQFYIFDVHGKNCELVEQRHVDHYCLGGHSDKSAIAGILETVSDCQAVFVAKIGDGPTEKLSKRDIDAVSEYAYEEIEPSLLDYTSRFE
ncbi:MAG: NifB/NifX family molybdenum-iron cluster-binding protein [Gammaproteobacteria bacterium]